jgi:chromate transporter
VSGHRGSASSIVARMSRTHPDGAVSFRDALRFWTRLGFISFGGPTGQIAIMHDELVERRRWIEEDRFLHALNFSMLLPGPEAHQLAIYIGWLLHGLRGALVAGTLFILPALVLMLLLSWIYVAYGDVSWLAAVFETLAWAVVGIVAVALIRIAGRTLDTGVAVAMAAGGFVALFVLGIPFPVVILAAGGIGAILGARIARVPGEPDGSEPQHQPTTSPSLRRIARVTFWGLAIWLLPLVAVAVATGTDGVIAREAAFFALMSLVTFGGAYAVLAYVNQAAVLRFGWLGPGEMAVGLSLAETTPGPLIMVVVFVGFVAAFRDPGALTPLAAGLTGGLVTAWATFVPSFLWILMGAPSMERLRGNRRLGAALASITAAVVGVIANLAVVFAVSVLFAESVGVEVGWHAIRLPVVGSIDLVGVAVAVAVAVALWRYRVNVVWVVLVTAGFGALRFLLT